MMQSGNLTIGIDVSKTQLDVCVFPENHIQRFGNNPAGIEKLIRLAKSRNPLMLVFEPSGGYEKEMQQRLLSDGLPCAKVNARQIREFARCTGRLAKTDILDSQVLARYGATIKPDILLEKNQNEELIGLTKRRGQLVGELVREKNRLDKKPTAAVQHSIKRHTEMLEAEIKMLEKEIALAVNATEELRRKTKVLTSVYGIGINTAAILIAELPELGKLGAKPIASLAGLAPHSCDSGNMRGKRMISGGRIAVRCALYMATVTAIRKEGAMRSFYLRLKQQGKPSKVALTAVMRKLLVQLNAKMRDEFYNM